MTTDLQESGRIRELWDKYNLPEVKRNHMRKVAQVAEYLSSRLVSASSSVAIDRKLLLTSSLLHDIDKNIPRLPGENHPQTGVRILREEGMEDVAEVVAKHSLHSILDPRLAPQTWEEKLLYLADKMVKHDVIGVKERFRLWNEEHLPPDQQEILNACYPKVQNLSLDILRRTGVTENDIIRQLTG